MTVARVRRSVDEVVAGLLEPLRTGALAGLAGYRLLSWDAEQGVSLTLARGDRLVLVELEPRDEARPCLLRTARFNLCARQPFDATAPLDAPARAAVDAVAAMLRAREGELPDLRATVSRRAEVRELEVDRVLVPEGAGHYYLNPYVGCMIGCEFCYVAPRADLSRALEGLPRLAWGRWVDVKVNAAEVLRREVREHRPGLVRLSPILTDPYQPLERRYHVTRACLEVLLDAGFAPVVLTRGAAVVDDLDVLRRFPRAAVGFSIPSDDDRMRAAFEPGGDPVDERLDALERCHAAGIRTFAIVQPMLPMDAPRLVARLAPIIDAVRVDRMYHVPTVQHLYDDAGVPWAARDEFFARTGRELRAGFAAAGVPFDEMDDMSGLVGSGGAGPGESRAAPERATVAAVAAGAPGRRALVRVGYACNNCCSFCRSAARRQRQVDAAAITRAIDAAARAGLGGVAFSGGEPTMRRDLPRFVRQARARGLAVELITNGRLLGHAEVVARLAAAGVERVTISLHGPQPIHDALTQAPSFAQSLAAVRNVLEAGLTTTVVTVVTRANLEHLGAVVDLLAPMGRLRLLFAQAIPTGAAAASSATTIAGLEDAARAVSVACAYAREAWPTSELEIRHAGLPWCLLPGLAGQGTSRRDEGIDCEWDGDGDECAPLGDDGFRHPEPCRDCPVADRCPGVHEAYLRERGCPPLRPMTR